MTHGTLAMAVRAALSRCSSRCLDDEGDRDAVLSEVMTAIVASPDAVLVRQEWAEAPTAAGKITVTRGIGGRREGALLQAAGRLAGLP